MKKVINIWKPQGLTPYQLVLKWKNEHPEYEKEKIGYAGRLDPMAEGVMILLVGEENKKRKDYEKLSKIYEFKLLFGAGTDTYDGLGLIKKTSLDKVENLDIKIEEYLADDLINKTEQYYPPYSYVKVMGKPLYWWARNKKLNEISIPKKNINIDSASLREISTMKASSLEAFLAERIDRVKGDFRQKEILRSWKEFLGKNDKHVFQTALIRLECSSGVYVRGIADELGKRIGVGGIALTITRLQVGDYKAKDAVGSNFSAQ